MTLFDTIKKCSMIIKKHECEFKNFDAQKSIWMVYKKVGVLVIEDVAIYSDYKYCIVVKQKETNGLNGEHFVSENCQIKNDELQALPVYSWDTLAKMKDYYKRNAVLRITLGEIRSLSDVECSCYVLAKKRFCKHVKFIFEKENLKRLLDNDMNLIMVLLPRPIREVLNSGILSVCPSFRLSAA